MQYISALLNTGDINQQHFTINIPVNKKIVCIKYMFCHYERALLSAHLAVPGPPELGGSHHLLHLPAAEEDEEHDGRPERDLAGRDPHQYPASPVGPLRVGDLGGKYC